MKNKNLSWFAALLVFALLLWCTAATPGKIADPSTYTCAVYSTIFSLLPPVIAIVLALNTKEVYTSLLVGIASGALLYANGNLELAINTLFFNEDGGMVAKLSDSSNVGILVFLVMLGILVALMNKAGGSAAFGRWASTHIHSRAGAQFATLLLGVMIFVDDYFNCLTVGSVMRPVTDRQKVSRAKLAYLIDATAAPVCIIAPVSSWAAAVTSSVPEGSGINGFTMFLRTIPYNYYALLTLVMSLFLIFTGTDFGSMKLNEDNAKNGDLFTTADRPYGNDVDDGTDTCGHVADLLAPVLVLIVACIFGMIYTGGFFEGVDFVTAFADCNASAGLVLGSSIALLFTFVFYRVRNVMTFQDFAACIPEGFKAMVSPMLILSLAWTLSGMTGLLGAKYYVANLLSGSAAALQYMLPVIIFLVAVFLAFATGTSWGTFSILIPIVCHAFPEGEMLVISIAACLSGAVCGDHCSPISDTTIMASAGAHCSHVNHVSTQLPYAITAASCAAVCYVITGIAQAFLGANGSLFTSLILLAVAIGVLFPEVPQHLGKLFQIGGFGNPQLVGPVAAVQHAEKAVHVGVVQIVFVLHVAEPVDVAVLGGGGGAQIRVGFVKSFARGAGGVFVNDIVQRQDQPLFGQRKQQRIVQRVHLYNIGQLLAGGQQCAQCVGVLRGVDDLPGNIQVCLVEPAVQNLKGAVFSDFVPVITGCPPFCAHDGQVTFLPG